MGNYENLKQSITEVIRTNGNQEITGAVLQSTLLTIISTVGANATFAGIATPTTNPGTPDGPVFWLTSESGTYSNFGNIELQDGLSVLTWNGSWSGQQIFSIDDEPTAESDNLVKSGGVYAKIKSLEDAGYIFAGIATPTTNPGTPDQNVFYLASVSGTYSNFNAIELQDELSVLMWNGSWSTQPILSIDDKPTANSDNLVKSGGVYAKIKSLEDAGYAFAGIATPTTNPDTPDQNVFYIASKAGTYTNFGNIELQYGLSVLMRNGSSWVSHQMLSIDDVPTVGSDSLVKSGGVFNNIGAIDISELNATENPHTLATYEDLTSALNALPTSYRKGGMSVKFVQSSGNSYMRYNLIANEFTTDVTKWVICNYGVYIDNSEFINAKTDKEGKVLEAIRSNGTKVLFGDLEVIGTIHNIGLASKVNKEEGKGLIDNEVANNIFYIESNEWLYLMLDNEKHILYGIKKDGSLYEAEVNQTEVKESYIINPDIKKTELLGGEKMKNHIGVNVHVNYFEETAIFDHLLNTAKECGASMFRSMGENADAAFVCKQNNFPVWISKMAAPATVLEKDERGEYVLIDGKYVETADFIDYINDVTRIVTKFNGATDITLSSGNTEKILADFFECCNEWYFDNSITTLEVFYTYKKIYSIIKSISPKTKFVVGSQIASEYTTALFDFVDGEGTRFTDIFDVYNYHYYSNSIVDSIGNGNYINSKVNINYDVFKENLADKDIWVTETGDNIRAVSLNNQARNLLHRMLISFSYGVDLVTYYAYMAYEDMFNTFEVGENYYGIIHRAIHNSYATIHDGGIQGKGIYGPDPVREYLSSAQWHGTQAVKPENLIIIDISNNSALNNIISNGVQISGNGFVVDKACVVNPVNGTIYDYFLYRENKYHNEDIFKVLDISNTNNWSGTKNITTENVDFFKLNPNLFVDLEDFVREGTQVSDGRNHIFILIYVTNISDTTFKYEDQSTWDDWKFEPLPAYKSLSLLSQLLDEGSTRPIRNYYLGVNIFNWKNSKGNNVWCMFTDGNSKTIKLEFENQDNGMMIDYQGNIISGITSSIEVTSYPVFFVNTLGKLEISNI